jgi:mannitol/fructose-specific phosphotransferase system IIA component (Ntr-type)
MAVVLADLLQEDHVALDLQADTQVEALQEIIALRRGEQGVLDPAKFLEALLARERENSTIMGNGVAFPHARTDLVEEIVLGIGRSVAGVIFGPEGERVHLLFVIGVPRRMVAEYLVCVGALARLVRNDATRTALLEAKTAKEFVELLRAGSLVLE